MADSAQGPQDPPSGPSTASGLAMDVQGVASVYDFIWRAGTQVTQAVGGAVAKSRDRKSIVQAQKSYLGPWSELAYYDGKRSKTPVLKADKFRDYMVDMDGSFKPGQVCTARADWAQFLHALGIIPSNNLLTWKSPRVNSAGSVGSMNIAPELEIDGEVLCHILNLFGEEDMNGLASKTIEATDMKYSTATSFARVLWDEGDPISPRLALGDDESITSARLPFGQVGELMESGTLITKHYFNAIYQSDGCSDAEFAWPNPETPLAERIQDLCLNISKLSALPVRDPYGKYEFTERLRKECADQGEPDNAPRSFEQYLEEDMFPAFAGGEGPRRLATAYARYVATWDGGVLLTRRWLEEADRIWRRATCGDGSDDRFLNDVYRAIDQSQEMQDVGKQVMKTSYIRPAFKFEGDPGFTIDLRTRKIHLKRPSRKSANILLHLAKQIVRQVLESYKDADQVPEDSWKHDLYTAHHEVYWLIFASKNIVVNADYVRFLHFGPESALWNGTWTLKSE